MIDENAIFAEVRDNISMMCRDDCVGADLAGAIGVALENNMKSVCVTPTQVVAVWPWLEKSKIKIISRFSVDGIINDEYMSNIAGQINNAFRDGAHGAIVFVKNLRDLQKFVAEIINVRESLFFNKSFSIGIDIDEIGAFDWDNLFGILRLVRADSLTLTFQNDTGNNSDFVGRVFAMLNAEYGTWGGVVNFAMGQNFTRIDQVFRLIKQIKPESISKTEFFIDNE